MWERCRDMANEDSDFDAIRDEPAFRELVARDEADPRGEQES